MHLEDGLAFQPYQKKDKSSRKSKRQTHAAQDLLLHSDKHRTLDYTAREEEDSTSAGPTQRHYIGIYDPKTGGLEVVEAKRMVVRGTVRAKQADDEAMIAPADAKVRFLPGGLAAFNTSAPFPGSSANPTQSYRDQKVDLGQTFGTKKARKVIESIAMNALTPAAGESNADGSQAKLDAASKATLSQIGQITSTMATRDELQAAIDQSKPVPRPNLDATEIADVYDPRVMIGAEILRAIPVRDWQESIDANEDIQLMSRYVARRIQRVGRQEKPADKLRLLRYLYFLLCFFMAARPGKRDARRVPPKDVLAQALSPAPSSVIENIRRKFSEGGEIRKFHTDLIATHCCALSAIIDNFETEPRDLREDLRLDQRAIAQYFAEIGARMGQVKKAGEAKAQPVAKLALPLQFPKMSRGAPKRR